MAEPTPTPEPTPEPTPTITPEMFQALQDTLIKVEANNKALLQEKLDSKKATDRAIEEAAKKNGDVEALEKSWSEKLTTEAKQYNDQLSEYKQTIYSMTAVSEARRIAEDLAVDTISIEALIPHIQPRLTPEIKDGKVTIRVLDKDGNLSAMTIDDLMKDIKSAKHLARLLKGSLANGSGSPGGKGASGSKTMKRSDFDVLSEVDQDAFISDGGKPVDA